MPRLVLVQSLKSSILSSTSSQLDDTFWGVGSAAVVVQSRRKANMVAQGDGKFGPSGLPQYPFKTTKNVAIILDDIFIGFFCVKLFGFYNKEKISIYLKEAIALDTEEAHLTLQIRIFLRENVLLQLEKRSIVDIEILQRG